MMNTNTFIPNDFRITIGNNELQEVAMNITDVSIPAIGFPEIPINFKGEKLFVPGEIVDYGSLSLQMLLDEDLTNWTQIFDWIVKNNKEGDLGRATKNITVVLMTNKKNANVVLTFHGAFPTSLGNFDVSSQNTTTEPIHVSLEFRYTKVTISRVE